MKVLVTGGAGFIGSYLIPKMLERQWQVVVFDLASDPASLKPFMDQITYVRGDLGSAADLYRAMMTHRPQGVFHLGAVLAEPCAQNPVMGFRVNFQSTQTLLDASKALGVRRFFMISSISVFGRDVTVPVSDHAVKNPETIYGQTKLAGEHLLQWYAREHGLDARALRFTWVFGPGRTTGITALWSSAILDAVAQGRPITIPNPDEEGDWLYIKDAVKAIFALWDAPQAPQRIYNVAGGAHTIREIVDIALRLRPGAPVKLIEGGAKQSPYPSAYDDGPARRDWNWSPDYTIEDAVREHLEVVSRSKE